MGIDVVCICMEESFVCKVIGVMCGIVRNVSRVCCC